MDMQPYIDALRGELLGVAETSGDETRALVERLVGRLESSVKLTLLSVLSAAVEEISFGLAPGSVDLRLRDMEPDFVVVPPPAAHTGADQDDGSDEAASSVWSLGDEGGATARINFRPPESLKVKIEEVAARNGLSVNAWLVRAAATALQSDSRRAERRSPRAEQHLNGWAR